MFNKTWINSSEAFAAQHQKDLDLEEYLPLEPYQVLGQSYGQENFEWLMEKYRTLFTWSTNFLALWNVFTTFLSLVYFIENDFIQSVINKELHVIFVQPRIKNAR